MKPALLRVLLALILTASGWGAPAIQVEENLVLSEDPLPFGKPAELVLTVSWDNTITFTPPPASGIVVPGARMLDAYAVSGVGASAESSQVRYHLVFTRFEPGDFTVGPVEIPMEKGVLKSRPLTLTFTGAQAKEGDKQGEIRAIKPVVELTTADFWKRVGSWAAAALAALALLTALIHYSGVLDRLRSPKSRALRRLKRARRRALEPEALLLESVETLRDYLAGAYGLPAQTSTSEELLRGITMDNRCTEWRGLAENLLSRCDRVKFAQRTVAQREVADLISQMETRLKAEKRRVRS